MNIMLEYSSTKTQGSKLPPFLERKRKILFKLARVHYLDTVWVEKFLQNRSLWGFAFLAKIRKLKMAAIFENFLKSCHIY